MKKSRSKFQSIPALSPEEIGLVQRSGQTFARHTDKHGRLSFQIQKGSTKETVVIPAAVALLFKNVLAQMSEGHSVTVMPQRVELTTQEAADLLNVSRPYLVGLLDSDRIPSRKVGTHRRVHARDVIDFKRSLDTAKNRALDELTRQAQELSMGY